MCVCISEVARGTLQRGHSIYHSPYRCGRDEKSAWYFKELLHKIEAKNLLSDSIKSRGALFLTPIITSHPINYF